MSSADSTRRFPYRSAIATLDPEDAQIRVELGFNYLSHQDRPADGGDGVRGGNRAGAKREALTSWRRPTSDRVILARPK